MSDASPAPRARRDATATLALLAVVGGLAVVARSLIVAPFAIPSPSMLPRLMPGDDLLVAKWSYGWSRYSLPFAPALFAGRLFARVPRRGDVVVFRVPGTTRDYVKRLIGLPGDSVQMRGGRLVLNGREVPRWRVADFVMGEARAERYRERLPGGKSYDVLAGAPLAAADDTALFRVPSAHYFMLGDNRDDSADSRFATGPDGGVGYVPAENVIGRAVAVWFSSDGTASWWRPWRWPATTRWSRIGAAL